MADYVDGLLNIGNEPWSLLWGGTVACRQGRGRGEATWACYQSYLDRYFIIWNQDSVMTGLDEVGARKGRSLPSTYLPGTAPKADGPAPPNGHYRTCQN